MAQVTVRSAGTALDGARSGPRCRACQAKDLGVCAALDPAAKREFQASTRQIDLAQGDVLVREGARGTELFTVVDGVLMLSKALPDGRRQIVDFRYPGDLMTIRRADRPWPVTVQAVTPASICAIDDKALDRCRRAHPELDRALLDRASDEIRAEQDHLLSLGRKNMAEKVASFVLGVCTRTRRRGTPRQVCVLPMHRTEIADYLGLKTESVSRVFTRLRHDGILELPHPNRVVVLDWPALEALANGHGPLSRRSTLQAQGARGPATTNT